MLSVSGPTVAKTASGPKSNSCTFNSNLIRALNGFSAQPLSAFTVSLSPNTLSQSLSLSLFFPSVAFYLYNYCSPLYLSPFISLSVSLSYYHTVSNTTAHLTSFSPPNLSISYSCHFVSLASPFPLTPFLSFSTSTLLRLTFIFFSHHHHLRLSGFFSHPHRSKWRLQFSIFFHTHPISPLEAEARCTLYWCQGTAYHFHYSQGTIENGV